MTASEFVKNKFPVNTNGEYVRRNLEESMIEFAKFQFKELFEEIKHGDQEHQDWLENKMNEFSENIK